MSAIGFELLLEFGLVLLTPGIHQACMWRKGKLKHEGLRSAAKVFARTVSARDRAVAVIRLGGVHTLRDRCDAWLVQSYGRMPMAAGFSKPSPGLGSMGTYSALAPDSLTTLAHLRISIC